MRVASYVKDFILSRDSRKIVFRAQGCGLANRLRALVGYQALARVRELPFYLVWAVDSYCPGEFSELFESSINPMCLQALRSVSPRAIYREPIWWQDIWKRWGAERDWIVYRREVHDCLRALTLQRGLAEKVAEFQDRHNLSDAIGVHIRNTDNLANYAEWKKHYPDFDPKQISSVAGFMEVIDANVRSRPVFLATDDPELEQALKERFPALITFPKTYDLTTLRTASVGAALSEMWLLGRCHRIVGTYYSSFGQFSAVWGRVPYFEVIGDKMVRSEFIDQMTSS